MSDEKTPRREEQLVEDRVGMRARVLGTERAILVSILYGNAEEEESLRELESLADTAGIQTLAVMVQKRPRPHPATFIGRGKVDELKAAVGELEADVVIFNDELRPAQARNLETALNRKVIDRTQLIMDIFAQRAATKEAKLQVELAQLHYLLPRLRGWGTSLTRAGGRAVGSVGTRGPGETQLELDRNKIYRRIHLLERRLKKASGERAVRRQKRLQIDVPKIALIGYTNSGKSTLLNRLCQADAFVEDKLFATLDTRVRRTDIVPGRPTLISDTVGFIQDLPHDLVPAFAATLEAAQTADLLLHVVDVSKPLWQADVRAVMETLETEIFHDHDERPPILTVLNKIDRCEEGFAAFPEGIPISAEHGTHVEGLRTTIAKRLFPEAVEMSFMLPHQELYALHPFTAAGRARIVGYAEEGACVEATLSSDEWRALQAVGAELSVSASSQDEEQ
ncbi:GTPase HflX [Candidatus Bipolaricaulota bacterium]